MYFIYIYLFQRCAGLPLNETTNVSPVAIKQFPAPSLCDVVLDTDRLESDAEHLRSSERFSRSVTPRGRRLVRRRKIHKTSNSNQSASKVRKLKDLSDFFH